MLKLYSDRFWISPWVFSCFVALEEKGVPFELVELGLDRRETRTPEYVGATITGKVPAIDHDGVRLAESSAILEYLDETFPGRRLLPADARERARARQVMSFLRTDVFALREDRGSNYMFYEHNRNPLGEKARADADKLFAVAGQVVKGASMFGEWTIADSELAFCLQRLGMNGDELPASLREFVAAQWARPSVQKYVKHQRPAYVPY